MIRLALVIIFAISFLTDVRADEFVLSVDTDRIASLARQAIAESQEDVDPDKVEFTAITMHQSL